MRSATVAPGASYRLQGHELLTGEYLDSYVLKVKDLPDEQRPREKLVADGPKALSVTELVAILLGVGTRKEEVMSMARRILKEYGEKSIIAESRPQKLAEALNIPLAKACQLVAAFELGRRFFAREAGRALYVRNAQQAYQYLSPMGYCQKEQLRGLYLNSRYQVVHDEIVSVGSLTANIIHPREVFRPAIEHGAVAVIIAHNHPSGSLEPTAEDLAATEQLIAAGKLLGIDVLDHLIIAANKFARITKGTVHA